MFETFDYGFKCYLQYLKNKKLKHIWVREYLNLTFQQKLIHILYLIKILVKIFSCILNLHTCKRLIIILTENFYNRHFNYNIILIILYYISIYNINYVLCNHWNKLWRYSLNNYYMSNQKFFVKFLKQ